MEGKGPGWWNGHCFRPILGYTCYLFLGTVRKTACVLLCIYVTSCNLIQFHLHRLIYKHSCKCLLPLHQALGFLMFQHHVCDRCFGFFFVFFLHRFQEFCVGWWRCLEGGFLKWNECRRWLLLSSCSLFILPSCLRARLWAGHRVVLGYCLFDQTQTKSILQFDNVDLCGRKLELALRRTAVSVY